MATRSRARTSVQTVVEAAVETRVPPPFERGDVLSGNYEIRGLLGEGGMAWVFEAHDRALNRTVAIKVERFRTSERPSRLQLEAQALAAVRHPALVAVHGLGEHLGTEFLVQERILGATLAQALDERRAAERPFELTEAVEILGQLAECLAAVDAAGGAHRDVKPSNIMLAPNRVVLMDFGVFRPETTRAEELIAGTPEYMAPEAIENRVPRGGWFRVDLYALGIVGYEILAGAPPFVGEVEDVLRQHLSADAPDLTEVRPEMPRRLARLLAEMIAKHPNDRPANAEAVAGELRAIRMQLALGVRERPMSVLIVDDSEDLLSLAEQCIQLVAPSTEVTKTRDARTALEVLRRRLPDLLLVDLDLPGMNGLELCASLRGNVPLSAGMTIVCVSGVAGDDELPILKQLGVRELIRKGRNLPRELGNLMRRYSRRPTLPPPVPRT